MLAHVYGQLRSDGPVTRQAGDPQTHVWPPGSPSLKLLDEHPHFWGTRWIKEGLKSVVTLDFQAFPNRDSKRFLEEGTHTSKGHSSWMGHPSLGPGVYPGFNLHSPGSFFPTPAYASNPLTQAPLGC